ncbi:MAG: DUF6176 family protein [Sporolactobacillus sp.]
MLLIECTRFRVKRGLSNKVDEWMAFLNAHMNDVLLTLDGEKMYIETIFREQDADAEYLYWYSIQGAGGNPVEKSDNWIDKQHLLYWQACIDSTYPPVDLTPEVSMIPNRVRNSMLD